MHTLSVTTKRRMEFVDITEDVENLVRKEGVKEGVCVIFCPHTTAGLTINENADPSVQKDIIDHLARIIPYGAGYTHSEGNADSHIKASLVGSSLNVIIHKGTLILGRWQEIYFCEFDGPRHRKVYIKVIRDQ